MIPFTAPAAEPRPIRSKVRGARRWLASLARRSPADSGGVAQLGRRYIYILPTASGLLLGCVLVLMLLGSLNYQNNLALLFTFVMSAIAIVGMLHSWLNLLDLRVASRAGPPVFDGQEAVFSFFLEEERGRARGALAVRSGKHRSELVWVDPFGSQSARLAVPTEGRGWVAAKGLCIETSYPLGLFRAWAYPASDARVRVYPRPAQRSPAPHPVPALKASDEGDLGVGADDFTGPRPYRPGDSPRRLDWKALARERGLVIKQFGGDRAAQVWIDWDRVPAPDSEARVSLLCRQVLDAAEQGLSYGLNLPGAAVPIGHGEVHKHRCLACLADFGRG